MPADGFRLERCDHPLVESIYRDRSLPLEGGGSAPLDVYIPREQGDYLYSLVRHYRPEITVEVGLANGLSALFIAIAHSENGPSSRHIAVDPFQHSEWAGVGMGLIRQAGLADRLRLVERPSHQGLPQLEAEGVKAGLIFIERAHLFDYVMTDFLISDRLLEVGGLMAFDDSDWPAVQGVIRYVLANRHYGVVHPEVVIEKAPGRPGALARSLRGVAGLVPPLAERLRPDFLVTSDQLNIRTRCVVLRKAAEDDRDSQSQRSHRPF